MSGEDAKSAQEFYAALRELRDEPYGAARSARTEELAARAEELELDEPLATALISLIDAYEYGAEPRKLPLAFARALKLHDAKPSVFDENETYRLFWCFKWVTSSLLAVPEVPLETVRAWIEQMRDRYSVAGHGQHAVHAGLFAIAAHTGSDIDFAYECWATRPRDAYSDCEACEARARGRYRAGKGDFARALEEWQPVLEGAETCSIEPAATTSESLLPLVRLGRLEDAASYHRSGYRLTRGEVGRAAHVGRHLEFAALTGNAPRGLELLAENRGRFDVFSHPAARLDFLTGVRVLLNRLVAEGAEGITVPGPAGAEHTAASLLARIAAETDELAAAFDARNSTSHVGEQLRSRCALEPLTETPLALGVRSALPAAAMPASPATARTAVPEEFATLLAAARQATKQGRPDADALWAAVAKRVSETELDDLLRAELANREAAEAVRIKQWALARERFTLARELMTAAGEPGRAVAAWSRALWATSMAHDAASAPWDDLDEVLRSADELLAADRIAAENYCAVLHCRAVVAALPIIRAAGEERPAPDGAASRFEHETAAMREASQRFGTPHHAGIAAGLSADVAGSRGETAAALAALREAVDLLERSDRPWMLPGTLTNLAVALHQSGEHEEAKSLLGRALALAGQWPDLEFDQVGALAVLAEICRHSGDHASAARHFADVAARADRDLDTTRASYARASLGQILLQTGRVADCVAILESLLGGEEEAALNPRARAQARLDLGRGLARLGEHRAAAESFLWLADFVSDWDEDSIKTMVACELTGALARAGMRNEARAAADRALTAHKVAPNPAAVCAALRVCADKLATAEQSESIDEVLEYLRQADEINEATPESENYRRWPESALNAQLRAQGLAEAGRNGEALEAIEQSIAAWQQGGDEALEPLTEATRIAAVIEGIRLGRKQQARERLAPLIVRCNANRLTDQANALIRLSENLKA
ncbi:MAG TPA: tetratricopeptide repeat protein [Actinocrinis sp.]|nr:tetratricopeptide repeat protein [Actinocrinis sp.]